MTFAGFLYKEVPKALDGTDPEDFPNYYFSGRRLFSKESIYRGVNEDVYEKFGWSYKAYPADPPSGIIFLSPFSFLPYKTAWIIFGVFSVLLLAGTIFFTAKKMGYSLRSAIILSTVFLGSAPFLYMLKRNHMEMWVVFFAVLGWSKLKKRRKFLGRFLWGIAGALKLFPLLWLFVSGHRDKKSFFRAAVLTGVIIWLSFFIVGFENSVYFLTEIIPRSEQWYGAIGNYSIVSLGYALKVPRLGWSLGILLGCSVFYPKLWTGPVDDIFIKSITLSLLLTPLSWVNYQVLLFPCLIILGYYIPFDKKNIRWIFIIICIIIWGWPADLQISFPPLNILMSSLPPLLSTAGIFSLSHFYIFDSDRK